MTISPEVSFRVTTRTYLSMVYLTSAALMAKKAFEIESVHTSLSVGEPLRCEHQAFSAASILMSASALEAFANEFFAECHDHGANNHMGLPAVQAAVIGRVWSEIPSVERAAILEKFEMIVILLGLPELDRGHEPYQGTRALLDLRNALMHYKLTTRDVTPTTGEETLDALGKKLKGRFEDNSLTGVGNPFFPDRIIGHGAAEWSVKTAVMFLDGFCNALSVTPPYDKIRDTFVTR